MATLVDQTPALAGVIIGTLGALIATSLSDRIRWKRDQLAKWDQARLNAYIQFANSLKEIYHIASRLTAGRRAARRATPIDRGTGLQLLVEAERKRSETWEAVLLMGDAATISAGRNWHEAVAALEKLARADEDVTEAWPAASTLTDQRRDDFYRAARRSLDVRGAFASHPRT